MQCICPDHELFSVYVRVHFVSFHFRSKSHFIRYCIDQISDGMNSTASLIKLNRTLEDTAAATTNVGYIFFQSMSLIYLRFLILNTLLRQSRKKITRKIEHIGIGCVFV